MEKNFCISLLALCIASTATLAKPAEERPNRQGGGRSLSINQLHYKGVAINDLSIARNNNDLFVAMEVNASGINMKPNRELRFTPAIVSGNDTLRFESFTIAGRNRYYYHIRNDKAESPKTFRSGKGASITYRDDTAYRQWMERSTLILITSEHGCAPNH